MRPVHQVLSHALPDMPLESWVRRWWRNVSAHGFDKVHQNRGNQFKELSVALEAEQLLVLCPPRKQVAPVTVGDLHLDLYLRIVL